MAKIVWLGEPEGDEDGPRRNVWNNITFARGEEVDVDNPQMIAKARKNPFYSVDGEVYVPEGAQPHPNAPASGTNYGYGEAGANPGPVIKDKTQLSEMNVAELREVAAERGIDVEGLSKAEIREKLAIT